MWRQLRCLAHNRAVDVADAPAGAPHERADMGQQHHRIGTTPPRVGVGKVLADVAKAGSTKQRVGGGMGNDIGITVAIEAGAFEGDTAEHEPPGGIIAEPVDVEALPDARVAHMPSRTAVSRAHTRSSRSVILRLAASPATTTTRPPSSSTSAASSVAEAPHACAARNTSARKACGVCTATNIARGGVSTTRPSASIRLIVSATATPGTAPSAPSASASRTVVNSGGDANGRAASCTQMIVASAGTAASPARTDSLRVAPPGTPPSLTTSASGTTSTTPSLTARAVSAA